MPCVIDSSVALNWTLPDEDGQFDDWARRLTTEFGVVPAIWFSETSNGVLMALRRGRINADQAERALTLLNGLAVTFDDEGTGYVFHRTFALARAHNLTVYDASYVELAMRRALPLITLDGAMRGAAERLGVIVPPPI